VEQLDTLLRSTETHCLVAYQVAFDMVESENQGFVVEVVRHYPALKAANDREVTLQEEFSTEEEEEEEKKGGEEDGEQAQEAQQTQQAQEEEEDEGEDEHVITNEEYTDRLRTLRKVLCDNITTDISLNFLFKQCHADVQIVRKLKDSAGRLSKASLLHHATLLSHGIMYTGTAIDGFLRDNIDWFGKGKLWSKFSGVASIGMIHKGHVHESMDLLEPYLPAGGMSESPHSEGGALFALGLIHANHSSTETVSYLTDILQTYANQEVVLHGACLGLGVSAMGRGTMDLYTELLNIIYTDSAISGEAAALAIGLIFVGKNGQSPEIDSAVRDLIAYAHDTQHEKIIRALSMAVAFMVYGQEEQADGLIEQLLRDHDAIMRYGAVYAIGMAYVGTNNNLAVQKLLHIAVSDVNDDVRRAAVTCLGFVLFKAHEQVPKLVALLAESFNPHVRYGACMAVGIACAGTGSRSALELLKPMMEDEVDFVRQGVSIALALVLMQVSKAHTPFVEEFREKMQEVIGNNRQTQMAKMGAILATGIIDAGGRNMVLSMQSRAGFLKMSSIVGCALWLQFWYWHPLMNMFSLSLSPTMLLGLNKDFNIPKNFTVRCNAKPSLFAYPKMLEEENEKKKATVKTAVLSTTAKAKAKEARKEAQKRGEDLNTSKQMEEEEEEGEEKKGEQEEGEEKKGEQEEEPEPEFHHLSNPARITSLQVRTLSVVADQKYKPVRQSGKPVGIVMLNDVKPVEEDDVQTLQSLAEGMGEEDQEEEAPETFIWIIPNP
jgi:26S proteasome regulatory subunit N2